MSNDTDNVELIAKLHPDWETLPEADKNTVRDAAQNIIATVTPSIVSREWDLAHDAFCSYGSFCSIHGKTGDRALIFRELSLARKAAEAHHE